MRYLTLSFLVGIMTSQFSNASNPEDGLISHKLINAAGPSIEAVRKRIESATSLTLSQEETLGLLEELVGFDLGRFLLENKGLNGFWTAYLILHGPKKDVESDLEKWMLHQAPAVLATRERFGIFQQEIKGRLREGMSLASIPCGVMDDLLTLDYKDNPEIRLTGIDLDQVSLDQASENALGRGLKDKTHFSKESAWESNHDDEFDLITSNGLNIYEPNEERVVELYRNFARALKPDGVLITSFMTPPPVLSKESTWRNLNPADLMKQKALFADIIQASWQCFRTEAQTREQLEAAGLQVVKVIYDKCGMFPTVIAQKAQKAE